jgi:hypothetical protein
LLSKNPPYSATTDFAPVALIVEQPFLLVTHNNFPANNLLEFIAYARSMLPLRAADASEPIEPLFRTCLIRSFESVRRYAAVANKPNPIATKCSMP